MTGESGLVPRLQFLARVVRKECAHLALTDQRLFGAETTGSKFTLAQAKQLESDHGPACLGRAVDDYEEPQKSDDS